MSLSLLDLAGLDFTNKLEQDYLFFKKSHF
jgi:hypothetical protein